ncbi:trypsin-like serine peptidase [Actinocorallia populi]|uniref:trypsin-like serine peptidase n=1 Tax=Actinocorallia populi TaxID=2079200 RepID=UPI000D0911BE|nr:serine protease [Actinocorallia populi]
MLPTALLLAVGLAAPVRAAPAPSPVSQELDAPGGWTAERMRRAEAAPRDMPARTRRAAPKKPPPIAKAVVAAKHRRAPLKQIGRLYITGEDGRVATCTGTVVNTARPGRGKGNGSVLLTAAHCLQDPSDGWNARSLVFAPDLDREAAPHGLWNGYRTLMWSPWTERADPAFDYAFVAMARHSSGTIQKKTNGQSLRFDVKRKARLWSRLYGYAVQHHPRNQDYPEGGSVLRMCRGRTGPVTLSGGRFHTLKCNMSHGASGGPLIAGMRKSGYGRIVGVTSFRKEGEAKLYSPVLDKWAKDLFLRIRTVRVPLQEAPQDVVRVPKRLTAPGR